MFGVGVGGRIALQRKQSEMRETLNAAGAENTMR